MGCHGSYPFTFLNLSELAEQVSLPPLPETEESASPGWNQLSPVRALSAHPASYKTSRPVSKLEEDRSSVCFKTCCKEIPVHI